MQLQKSMAFHKCSQHSLLTFWIDISTNEMSQSFTKHWWHRHTPTFKASSMSWYFQNWVLGSVPGSGRYPGEGHSNPLQYFCLENPMDRGAWQATVQRVAKKQLKWLSIHLLKLSCFAYSWFFFSKQSTLKQFEQQMRNH